MNRAKRLIYKMKSRFMSMSPTERATFLKENTDINMGDDCEVHGDVTFGSEAYLIRLGNKVRLTHGVKFITHDGAMWVVRNLGLSPNGGKIGTIEVGDNVMIGQNSIIMQGIIIGSNVVVGAGSVVTKDIPSNTIVAGVPAKHMCTIEEYYEKNRSKIEDTKQMTHNERKEFYIKKLDLDWLN